MYIIWHYLTLGIFDNKYNKAKNQAEKSASFREQQRYHLSKAPVKISLKERHSTFIFTGHPLYGSFVIIMLANRKCEHTYLWKLKNNGYNNYSNLLVVTLKSMTPGFFINFHRKRTIKISRFCHHNRYERCKK